MRIAPFGRASKAFVLAGTLTLTLSACGGDDEVAVQPPAPPAAAQPVAALTGLTGKMTEVVVDAGFLAGLTSLKLTPGVVGTATLKDGTLAFPITGGNATYYAPGSRDPYVESSIKHDGSGLSLTDGTTKVELTNFVVDAGTSMLMGDVSANGASVAKGAPLFLLNGNTLEPLKINEAKTEGVLFGTVVGLTSTAAQLLNQTYKTDVLAEGFKVGIARITLALPAS